jgi:SAM-dependent methyltransferase
MYGMDLSTTGVRIAKKRGIRARVADLNENFPYRGSSFDMIISDQVLEHVFRTDHLLDEIYRTLKPGGVVITITPNLSFWLNRVLFLFGFYPMFLEASERTKVYGLKLLKRFIVDKNSMGHVRLFNKATLKDIFESHGYDSIFIMGSPLSWVIPFPWKYIYDITDMFFSLFPSLSRDLIVIANKPLFLHKK